MNSISTCLDRLLLQVTRNGCNVGQLELLRIPPMEYKRQS
jgi:hypothetical protein